LLIAFGRLWLLVAGSFCVFGGQSLFRAEIRKEVLANTRAVIVSNIESRTCSIAKKIWRSSADFDFRPEGLKPSKSKAMSGAALPLKKRVNSMKEGMWGGEHIVLWVYKTHARLEYDCAHGTIDQPIKVDSKGRFDITGTHVRESGGPVAKDERPDSHPALYTGQVTGKKLVITITLTDTKESVGTFTLEYGQKPSLFKCK